MITFLREWYVPRRRVVWWVMGGYTSFFLVFALQWSFAPRLAPLDAPLDRLVLALQLAAAPAAVLMLQLQGLWRLGDTVEAEADPLGGRESRRFKINQRVLSNTLEQTAIFVPMMVALALRIGAEHVFVVPWLVATWCVGRLLFWVGYQIDPPYRAIGMDWTTGAALVTAIWLLVTFLA